MVYLSLHLEIRIFLMMVYTFYFENHHMSFCILRVVLRGYSGEPVWDFDVGGINHHQNKL